MRLRSGRNGPPARRLVQIMLGARAGQLRGLVCYMLLACIFGPAWKMLVGCGWGDDKATQRRATYACSKHGGDGGDAARAETRGVPQPWAGLQVGRCGAN